MVLQRIFPLGMHKKSIVMIYLPTELFTIFPPVHGAVYSIRSFHAQPLYTKPYDPVFNDHIFVSLVIDKCKRVKERRSLTRIQNLLLSASKCLILIVYKQY